MQHDREMIPAMEFSEEGKEVWQRVVVASTDPYTQRIISYAEDWARLMQADMLRGRQLEDVADEASRVVDTDRVSGFMRAKAVQLLVSTWARGDQLRKWYNRCYALEDIEGTVNPALLVSAN